jgi:hypothetical protein
MSNSSQTFLEKLQLAKSRHETRQMENQKLIEDRMVQSRKNLDEYLTNAVNKLDIINLEQKILRLTEEGETSLPLFTLKCIRKFFIDWDFPKEKFGYEVGQSLQRISLIETLQACLEGSHNIGTPLELDKVKASPKYLSYNCKSFDDSVIIHLEWSIYSEEVSDVVMDFPEPGVVCFNFSFKV